MSITTLVPKRADARVVELLERVLERARAGDITGVAVVYEDATDVGGCYCGSATTLYFGIGLLMRDLEDDARGE